MSYKNSVVALLMILCVCALVHATPDQPNMESARTNLQKARAELQAAEPNKGGHRARAIDLVNAAIGEVNKGIKFARRNNHATISAPTPDQPHMEAALNHLKNAKADLERATPDKGGYRANAIRLVNLAIDQVNAGIAAGRN
jgi:hypothetical protein